MEIEIRLDTIRKEITEITLDKRINSHEFATGSFKSWEKKTGIRKPSQSPLKKGDF